MNEIWIEIVESLQTCYKENTSEKEYQHEIENCLKILGWKKSNGTMESQYTLQIGSTNTIRPDLLLRKANANEELQAVLPIEIKRPQNTYNEKYANQLISYMRQLRLNVGLFIGENIQFYYDVPNNMDKPVKVLTINIDHYDNNGELFCNILAYNNFCLNKLEKFCEEQYQKIQVQNNLRQRLSEYLSAENAQNNIKGLLKLKFMNEGFDEKSIDIELSDIDISIIKPHKIHTSNLPQSTTKQVQTIPLYTQTSNEKHSSRDTTKFSFDNIHFYGKGKFVLELIKDYISNHPQTTFYELQQIFPDSLHSKSRGVVRHLSDIRQQMIQMPDLKNRYFLKPEEIITLSNGEQIVINNQWGNLFINFLEAAKQLYIITSDKEYKPNRF